MRTTLLAALTLLLVTSLGGPALAARSADAERALSTARSLIDQGKPDAALGKMREAIKLAPGDVETHTEYIDLMLSESFAAEVMAEYTEYGQKGTPDALYLRGRVRAQVGDIEGARADFKSALAGNPSHFWSLEGLAGLALLEGRAEDAKDLFISARAVSPNRAEIHNKLAAVLVRTGDTEGAYASWKKATEIDPRDHHAWLNWGAMLSRGGDHEAAVTKLQQAVAVAPGYPLAHVNLAYVYARLKKYDDAVAHFEAALAINPRNTTVAGSRDLVKGIAQGTIPGTAFDPMAAAMEAEAYDPKLAKQKYLEVIKLAPSFAPAHMRLGLVNASLEDVEGAVASLRKAADLAPRDGATRYNLGYLLLGLEKADEALPHLTAAHEIDPRDPDAITGIALCHLAQGDADGALRWYGEALAANPQDPTLWVQYGTTLAATGDFDEGINAVNKALQIAPGFVAARAQLVSILREGRRYDEALAELDRLDAISPGNPSIAAERTNILAAKRAMSATKQAGGVRLSQILFLEEANARKALSELDSGARFNSVARTYGKGPEAARGGDVGYVNVAEMRPEVAEVVRGLSPGQRSEVVSVGKAWLIVQRTE
jgi:tetratricopeptide (TPR) repeat protein